MQTPTDIQARNGLSGLFRRELALDDARVRRIIRITGCTVIVVALAMMFQIPLPAYSAYLVFLASQEEAASTLLTAVGGLAAVTLAVAISILLYVFDAAAPALRIPLLAASTLGGTYLARTSRLGPIAFLAGFILVLSQTLLDDVPSPEFVTHAVLWLWVVIALPVGVTVLVNLLAGESPVVLARKRAAELMEAVAGYVENPSSADPARLREQLVSLSQLKNKAFLWNKRLKTFAEEDNRLLAIVLEVLQIARCLPAGIPLSVRQSLAAGLRRGRYLFLQRRGVTAGDVFTPSDRAPIEPDPSQAAMASAIDQLLAEASGHPPATIAGNTTPQPKPTSKEALPRTRSHGRFAFKVMCAVVASYATYTLLDWPGIRTAVTTCFFVSLTTVGESMHKLTLRLSGAILGGLLASLCIVFVFPSLTDIGQLCLVIAAVSAFCAWISTASDAIAYGGMQIAFAYFLSALHGYTPATDLTGLRDRVVGIIVGNVWITIFFTTLWPVSAIDQVHDKWKSVLRQLAELLLSTDRAKAVSLKLEICKTISEASTLSARALFEWNLFPRMRQDERGAVQARHIEQLASAVLVVRRLKDGYPSPPGEREDALASQRLMALATGIRPEPMNERHGSAPDTLLERARQQLDEEIDHVSRTI